MRSNRPFYVLFAGVNGAGKSTLFKSGMWEFSGVFGKALRVNPDEILVDQGGDWRSETDQIRAGREAVRRINQYLSDCLTFTQETTLAGQSILRTIREAKQRGYWVMLHYIGVEEAAIAHERVLHREDVGGHGIAQEVIERRWHRSLGHLRDVLMLCDDVYLYDNSYLMQPVARYFEGELVQVYSEPFGTTWFKQFLEQAPIESSD